MKLNRQNSAARKRLLKCKKSLSFETLEPRALLASDLYITEFLASNDTGLSDGDGNSSDWIEVFNASSSTINLADYYLTDDATELDKWRFPSASLESGQFQVVFASGQEVDNYVDPAGYFHTNFRIGADGEYLAAVYEDPISSDLSVSHEYSPAFTEQMTDVSYGLAMFGGALAADVTVTVETDIAPPSGFPGQPYTPTFAAGGPSSTDLLHGQSPTASSGNFELEQSAGLSVLTDGSVTTEYGSGHDAYATAGSGNSVTYSFASAVNIGEIVIYGGWVDGGRDAQNYEIEFSSDSGGTFTSLSSVDINPSSVGRPVSNRVSFANEASPVIAANVTDLRVNFLGVENGYTGYTEIDVFEATGAAGTVLVDDATPMSYLVPNNGTLGTTWTQAGFNDSAWPTGTAGIGYESSPGGDYDYTSLLDTPVLSGTTSAYTRFEFNLADPASVSSLTLGMLYDDGFVAYLNGVKVAEEGAPATPVWNSAAPEEAQRTDETVLSAYVDFDISQHIGELQLGTNVLAVHALNLASSSDMLMVPQLRAQARPGIAIPLEEGFFSTPTPGSINAEAFQGFVSDTQFSVDRGFYTTPISLVISSATQGASIVYTTDGSVPTVDSNLSVTNGTLFTDAINISSTTNIRAAAFKEGFAPTNVDTHTYVYLDDVIQQTASSQELALEQGLPFNAGNGVDFGLDPDIVNSFTTQQIKDSLLSIPTISLTLENGDFLGSNGIYTNSTATGPSSERPVSAELIHPDGSTGFQANAGIRIQGAASRSIAEKYSFRLAFRSKYGPTDLFYPLFGDGVDRFDTVVLRSVFNDGYGWQGDDNNLREQLYVRDLWFRETQLAMGQPAARGNWAHLYVNGQYWGLYHPSERPDADFAQETIGGDNDNYDTINHGGVIDDASENDPNNNVSANSVYNTAISLANAVNSASGVVNKNAAFQALQGNFADGSDDPQQEDYLDVENYIDYMILNMFGGNDDWPVNNWFTNRLRGPDSEGFRFYAWDSEISLSLSTRTNINKNYTNVSGGAAELYSILRNYEEFVVQFGDQIHKHMFNDGVLAGDAPAERFEGLASVIRDAIIGESARWGDQHFSNQPLTQAEWDASLADMLTNYFVNRPAIALAQFRGAGLYPTTDAPEFLIDGGLQPGGVVPQGASLGIQNPGGQGTIYFTTDGTDPRLVGGAINTASATAFSSNQAVTETTEYKARVLRNGEWSALSVANFVINPVAPGSLVITELNYNPYDALTQFGDLNVDNDEFEFIELRNVSDQPIDLADTQLVENTGGEGITFTFPAQVLSPNSFVLVVRNEAAFESRYGSGFNIAGEYQGGLTNGGEAITLLAADGSLLQSFSYDDTGSWPGRADGTGSSLEILDPAGDYSDGDNWRSSSEFGGSPGFLGSGPVRDVIVNEVLSHSDGAALDHIELYNTTDSAVDMSQWYLSDSNDNLFKYQFPGSTSLGIGQYLVLNETQFGFGLDGQFGDDVWLLESSSTGRPTRFADHAEFDATDTNVSLGVWANGDPNADLFPMTAPTLGSANSEPQLGDVVISEVHYHPAPVPPAQAGSIAQQELEFVEISNTGSSTVDVSNWRTAGLNLTFPVGTMLGAGESLVVVTFDPTGEPAKAVAFRSVFGVSSSVRLFGSATGQLNNDGERVKLLRPEDPFTLLTGDVLVDAVRYDRNSPWPITADGTGDSLQRTFANAYGGFVTSWLAAPGTPGSASLTTTVAGDYNGDGITDARDYTVWRDTLGSTSDLRANGDNTGASANVIDEADYTFWRMNFGATQSAAVQLAASNIDDDTTQPAPALALAYESQPAIHDQAFADYEQDGWLGNLPTTTDQGAELLLAFRHQQTLSDLRLSPTASSLPDVEEKVESGFAELGVKVESDLRLL